MTAHEFRRSALGPSAAPPPGTPAALSALWHDAHGDWARAHEQAQRDSTADGSWVHAYLHRKEGDSGNACHWYGRAGRPVSKDPLEDEWAEIAAELLSR
jgi:hypothetical protein